MSRLKNIAFSALLAVGAFSAVTYTSCSKDECEDVVCNNGGFCVGGSCSCPIGYEGSSCDTKTRDKFVGSWNGQDVCGSGTYTISLSISSSSNDINAIVANPGGFGTAINITGTVISATQLSFTNANVGGGRTLTGTMTFSGGSTTTNPTNMEFQYVVTPTVGSADNCTGTYTKL